MAAHTDIDNSDNDQYEIIMNEDIDNNKDNKDIDNNNDNKDIDNNNDNKYIVNNKDINTPIIVIEGTNLILRRLRKLELNIVVLGNVDAGKSTTIGCLLTGRKDNGNGLTRNNVFNYPHEIETGRTSCSTSRPLRSSRSSSTPNSTTTTLHGQRVGQRTIHSSAREFSGRWQGAWRRHWPTVRLVSDSSRSSKNCGTWPTCFAMRATTSATRSTPSS